MCAPLVAQWQRIYLPMQETQVESLGQEDPLEKVKVKSLSRVRLFATPWAVAYHASHPWDFPGKSTGVSCHFLLSSFSCLGNPMDKGARWATVHEITNS